MRKKDRMAKRKKEFRRGYTMITDEQLREYIAKRTNEDVGEIGGGSSYGQFWCGSEEYPYWMVLLEFIGYDTTQIIEDVKNDKYIPIMIVDIEQ